MRPLAAEAGSTIVEPLDVTHASEVEALFDRLRRDWGRLDFLVHSIAWAERSDLQGRTVDTSRDGFLKALEISAYSLIALSRAAEPLMTDGGSILTLTYYGSVKAVPNYNVMGIAKAALESSVRYLALDLGPSRIRINGISAGPIKTLAAAGVSGLRSILERRPSAPRSAATSTRRRREGGGIPALGPVVRGHGRDPLRRRRPLDGCHEGRGLSPPAEGAGKLLPYTATTAPNHSVRVFFTTLGCKLNQAEVDRLARQFVGARPRVVGALEGADLHVVNSCTVTSEAARDSRKAARRAARDGGPARTVLTGCWTSVEAAAARALEGVDLVVENRDKERLVDLVAAAFPDLDRSQRPGAPVERVPISYVPLEFGPARALVKIEDGCDMRCAFCIIPRTRGSESSRGLAWSWTRCAVSKPPATPRSC